ncbi:MAG TPA: LysR family transcriptional regulator [Caulobacteraceae bacterium]|jgi:DNA-binding transcriptional LysR family regulator|nr:LysR family transcriptional regulator [Caulobacteraceae bacterium]
MIELRRLRAFAAVAEEGNVTRAAAKLHMAQPPLSRLLHGLERDLGASLFERTSQGVRLTAAGEALAEEARFMLARAAEVELVVRRAAEGRSGSLAIGFTSSAGLHPFVSAALRRHRRQAPDVRLSLEEAGTGELVEGLEAGRLNGAFVRSPSAAPFRVIEILEEPMIAAMPDRPEARTAAALRLGDLAGADFVLYRRPSGPGLYDAILAACRSAGFSPRVVQEAPRLTATLALVAAGMGVSIVPASLSRLALEGVAFRVIEEAPGLVAPLRLILPRADVAPTMQRFVDTVEAAILATPLVDS